jgi:putative tricarboxylic transport membrane protein
VVAIGAVWLYGASQLAQFATYAVVGPGVFVTVTGVGLLLLGLVLLVQIARGERFEPQDAEDVAADRSASWSALLTAVAGAAVPLYTMERFGFAVTAALVFALTTRAFGSRRILLDLSVGAAIGATCWYVFTLLGVSLGDLARLPSLGDFLPGR